MKNPSLFAGWGKEEIIHHKKQVSVALTACKYLLSSLYKRVEERDTATAVSTVVTTITVLSRNNIIIIILFLLNSCSTIHSSVSYKFSEVLIHLNLKGNRV